MKPKFYQVGESCHLCGVNRNECRNRYCSDNPRYYGVPRTKKKKCGAIFGKPFYMVPKT
jgi:hypothetical protein